MRSLRDFQVMTEEERQARMGLALGKPVKASSSIAKDGATAPEAITVAGRTRAGRRSSPTRNGSPLIWARASAWPAWRLIGKPPAPRNTRSKSRRTGKPGKRSHHTNKGQGGTEVIRFAPVEARWVRMRGIRRATEFGYSIWELRVFGE